MLGFFRVIRPPAIGMVVFVLLACDFSFIGPNLRHRGPPSSTPPQIAFISGGDSWSGASEINVLNLDGTGGYRLVTSFGRHFGHRWSPDGTVLVFVRERDGDPEIHLTSINGHEQRNLSNHPAQDLDPAWSPVGPTIAFASDREGDFDIFLMDTHGNGVINLTQSRGSDSNPV